MTTLILSCGLRQSGNESLGKYDDTKTLVPLSFGARVWAWEPQSVSTSATLTGTAGSLMSKTRMPSQLLCIVAVWLTEVKVLLLRPESTLSTSRSPSTEMSFCAPGQTTCVTIVGSDSSLMSRR